MIIRRRSLGTPLIVTLSVGAIAGTLATERLGLVQLAQAQQTDDQQKKRKGQQPPPKKTAPPPKAPPPTPKAAPAPKAMPAPKAAPMPPKEAPTFGRRPGTPPPSFKGPAATKEPAPPKGETFQKGQSPRSVAPSDRSGPPPRGPGMADPKGPPGAGPGSGPTMVRPGGRDDPRKKDGQDGRTFGRSLPAAPGARPGIFGQKRLDEVQKERKERVEDGGRRRVIQEPGNRIIVKEGNRAIIRHDEAERFRRRPNARTERRGDGIQVTYFDRPGGVRVYTEVDNHGRLLRRYRRGPDGREVYLIDNRRFYRNVGVGVAVGVGIGLALNLARPHIAIPRERYIVEYDHASDEDLDEVLLAPPIGRLERAYSLEEIRYSQALREYTRRIDLDINFEFGAFEVGPDQYRKLERLARSMLRALRRNPDLIFLIEGHTDAVGSDEDNLSLSDRRATSVAEILTEEFGVPPENLVTQGYGEEDLKVDTQGPERLNRRVAVRNVTGLMSER